MTLDESAEGDSMLRLLLDAGVSAGMRVMDFGCGRGAVTRMLAKIVGVEGRVVGIDRSAPALVVAREKAKARQLQNVTFVQHDLTGPIPGSMVFDVAVARRVLMHVADPVATLRVVAESVRSGGTIVLQELDSWTTPRCTNPHPLHDDVNGWIWSAVSGARHMGFELPSILQASGWSLQHIRGELEIEGHHPSSMTSIVRAVLPHVLANSNVTEQEVDVDTLDERLATERANAGGVYVRNVAFGAWATKGA